MGQVAKTRREGKGFRLGLVAANIAVSYHLLFSTTDLARRRPHFYGKFEKIVTDRMYKRIREHLDL